MGVGDADGYDVGLLEGTDVGILVGILEGTDVGTDVGSGVGLKVGALVGALVGDLVGNLVGLIVAPITCTQIIAIQSTNIWICRKKKEGRNGKGRWVYMELIAGKDDRS